MNSESTPDGPHAKRSRAPRRSVKLPASLRLEEGCIAVTVLDLTHDGCKIETPMALLEGAKLELSIENLGTIDAEVRWHARGKAGLRFGSAQIPDQAPRRNDRSKVTADVLLRRAAGRSYRTKVFDVSPDGCKIEFVERPVVGEQLWVKFEGLDSLEAEVRWVDGHSGGIQFQRPIYPAVFELLLMRLQR
jgi:PilZ domain